MIQVTQTGSEGLKREFRVVVPSQDIDQTVDDKLQELSRTVRIAGFRPGKVPLTLVRKRFGSAVVGEVLEETLNRSSAQALTDHGVRPALPPKIELKTYDPGKDLEFTMSVETVPEIEPVNLATLSLTRLKAEVADKAIEDGLTALARQQKSFKEVAEPRPAKSGDALLIDFSGAIGGTPFEGGSAKDFVLELGSGMFVPGFEEQLVGAKPGDKQTVNVRFPDDYPGEAARGKDASFAVEVKQLLEVDEAKIDDSLATRLGLADLAALRQAVRERIERDYAQVSRQRLKRELLDALAASHDFLVPAGMVEQEFQQIWRQIGDDMTRLKQSWDDQEQTEEQARAEYRRIAERRVRLGLLLAEIGTRNNISVPQEQLNRAMMEQARRYPGQERKVFDYFRGTPAAMNELRAPLYEDRVVDFIAEMAKVTETVVSPEDLMRDPDLPAADAAAAGPAKTKAKAESGADKGG